MISGPNWGAWFANIWPRNWRPVLEGYRELARKHPDVLADIALRCNVFGPIREADAISAAREEGKRQAALEIMELCRTDPATLVQLVEKRLQPAQSKGAQ